MAGEKGAGEGPEPLPKVMDTLPPGTMVDQYEITGILGRGGMGTVYSGVQPVIGKQVAIKVINRELSGNPEVTAKEFRVANIDAISLSLDRDYLIVRGGVILRVLKREWVLNFSHVAWGRNITRTTGFSLGVILPFT